MRLFALTALGSIFLLTGCLDKMEKATDKMQETTQNTKQAVEETRDGQKLGAALELLPDDIAIKSAAAETMFIMAAEDRIYKYIGCTMPLHYPMGIDSSLPNVTFVGLKGDSTKNIAPVSPEKYEILEIATMRILRELTLKSQSKLTPAELQDVKSKAMRMFFVSTALLGAQPGPTRDRAEEEQIREAIKNQKTNQTEAAEKLLALASLFDDDIKFKVQILIETRFDHRFDHINPSGTL